MDKKNTDYIDLLDLFSFYLSKLVLIVIAMVLGGVLAFMASRYLMTPTYKATSKLYMVSASNDSIVNLSDFNIGSNLSEDYKELLLTRPIINRVTKNLNLNYNYEELTDMISISTIGSTRLLGIEVVSPDPKEAMDIANQLATEAVYYIPEVMETAEPNIAEEAILPKTRFKPVYTKNIVIGALALAVLCIGILTIQYLLDDTLKTSDDVEKYLGVLPLSVIPEGKLDGSKSKTRHSKVSGRKQ